MSPMFPHRLKRTKLQQLHPLKPTTAKPSQVERLEQQSSRRGIHGQEQEKKFLQTEDLEICQPLLALLSASIKKGRVGRQIGSRSNIYRRLKTQFCFILIV